MIKTLRITSVLAVVAAVVLIKYLVVPMFVGAGNDERVDKILDSPTVVEKFRETSGAHTKSTGKETSPLVQQATEFARLINPPPTVTPPRPGGSGRPGPVVTRPTSPKFKVFATTCFEGNPSLSQALIDEPGRDRRWVRQSSTVGGLFIEQIKDGIVVVKSGKDTYELTIETNPQAAPVKKASPSPTNRITGQSTPTRPSPTYSRAVSPVSRTPSKPLPKLESLGSGINEKDADDLIQRLRILQKSSTTVNKSRIDELISTFRPNEADTEDNKSPTQPSEKITSAADDSSSEEKEDKVEAIPAKPDSKVQK